ncbi:hypothetical protein SEA_ZETA1847_43 [Microbacterium phage Zeta1847]|uniref:Uncharacterized protein n=1 Tax=Microbacterium phage Zeta1847 TaxID=2201444 RepID=A0A2Z4Q9C6_9CAUD|nr:hypothetical protein HOT46_gp43 [Microbacterium phage Zeta1847]AWY06677.1 hypothetical protein SEA_ZETA1847_43 [Microbacterium phage Zeta1847]
MRVSACACKLATMTNTTATLCQARHVVTPDGEGVIVGLEFTYGDHWATRPTGIRRVKVGFGGPVTVAEDNPRRVGRKSTTYTFETVREYDAADVAPKAAPAARESVEDFIARKRDPKWRPAALPKPRRLPKLSDDKFAALMREHGATGSW